MTIALVSDDTNLTRAIERYRGTISTFARRSAHKLPDLDQEDIEQELYIVLWKCVENYDPDRGASFNTLFQGSAHNRIITLIRHYETVMRKPKQNLFRLDAEDVSAAVSAMMPTAASAEDWYIAVAEHGAAFAAEEAKSKARTA